MEELNGCTFSDSDLYFLEEMLWLRQTGAKSLLIGILPITQTLWGKIKSIKPKQPGEIIHGGRALCFIESRRYMGNIRAPFDLQIQRVNQTSVERPWTLQTSQGEYGWLCEVTALTDDFLDRLTRWADIHAEVKKIVNERGVICFKEVPDYVYAAVGIDCSQLLMVLSDKLEGMPEGSIIHVVADYNEGAERDLEKWSKVTGNEVLDFRVEKRLAHALIRRRAGT